MPTIEGWNSLTTASVVRIHVVQYTRVTTGICINSVLKCCAIVARVDQGTRSTSIEHNVDYSPKTHWEAAVALFAARPIKCLMMSLLDIDSAEPSRENSSDEGKPRTSASRESAILALSGIQGFPDQAYWFLRGLQARTQLPRTWKPHSSFRFFLVYALSLHPSDTEDASEAETVRMDEEETRSRWGFQ